MINIQKSCLKPQKSIFQNNKNNVAHLALFLILHWFRTGCPIFEREAKTHEHINEQ